MSFDGALAPLDCNLRLPSNFAESGLLQVLRFLLYHLTLIGHSLKHRYITKLGTRAKKLTNWQFLPSTIDKIRRINLGHQVIKLDAHFNLCLHHQII